MLGTLTCTRSDSLATSSSYPAITLTVNVASNASSSVNNTAAVSGGGESNTGNNSVSDTTAINGSPDLTVTLGHAGGFQLGGTGTVTLMANNIGTAATSGAITVSATLAAGQTPGNLPAACSAAGQTVTCTLAGPIAAGGSSSAISIPVAIANNAASPLNNTASISGGGELNTLNDTASESITLGTVPDLTVTLGHTGSFQLGGTGTVTLTANNIGTAATSGAITVSATLAAGQTPGNLPAGCSAAGQTVTCTLAGSIAVGGSSSAISIPVTIANNAASPLNNTASIGGGGELNILNDTTSDFIAFGTVPDLTVTLGHTGSFQLGGTGTVTLTANNIGTAATSGAITVSVTLASDQTAGTLPAGCSAAGQTVTCTLAGPIGAGSSASVINIPVTISSSATDPLNNTTSVSGGGELNTSNDTASDSITVGAVPDLTVTLGHTGSFQLGGTGTVTLTANNIGTAATSGAITLNVTLAAGLTAGTLPAGCSASSQTVTCIFSKLIAAGGSSLAISIPVAIANNAASPLNNTASISGGGELNTSNDTASDSITLGTVPDLTVTLGHTGSFQRGGTGTVTLTANNIGTAATSGAITVSATLAAGQTPGNLPAGCSAAGQTVTCNVASPISAGGSSSTISIPVTIANNAASTLNNAASVSGGGELNTSNDTAGDSITVISAQTPDLKIAKSHTGDFTQGQTGATYTINVTNTGSGPTSGEVTVTDTLPAGLTATAISGTGWRCNLGNLTCNRNDVLAAATSYPAITITVTVSRSAAANVINTATVSGGGDTTAGNNSTTDNTAIKTVQLPDLKISKTHAGNFAQGQTGATFTLSITNAGLGPTSGAVTVTDPLPSGFSATAIQGSGWSCALSSLSCTRSDVLPPESGYPPITLTVTVADGATGQLTNQASVSGGGDSNASNNSAADSVSVIPAAQPVKVKLIKTVDRAYVEMGDVITYQISVQNQGTVALRDFQVLDRLPQGFVFIPGTANYVIDPGEPHPLQPAVKGPELTFLLGTLEGMTNLRLVYRLQIGAQTTVGEHTNVASGRGIGPNGEIVTIAESRSVVTIKPGLISQGQLIMGRVFEDSNGNGLMDAGEKPAAGVRLYLSTGQSVSTDSEGLYSVPVVSEGSVVMALDPLTLPNGYGLLSSDRKEGESWARLLRTPLGGGTLLRQNFALAPQTGIANAGSLSPAYPAAASSKRPEKYSWHALPAGNSAAMNSAGETAHPQSATAREKGERVKTLQLLADMTSLPADGRSSVLLHITARDPHGNPVSGQKVRITTSAGHFLPPLGMSVGPDKAQSKISSAAEGPLSGSGLKKREPGTADSGLADSAAVPPMQLNEQSVIHRGEGLIGSGTDLSMGLTGQQVPENLREAVLTLRDGEAEIRLISGNSPETARIGVEAGEEESLAEAKAELTFTPELRPPILVTFGEVAIGRSAPEFALFNETGKVHSRGSAFYRSTIFEKNLVTFAYNSQRSLNQASGTQRLFQADPLECTPSWEIPPPAMRLPRQIPASTFVSTGENPMSCSGICAAIPHRRGRAGSLLLAEI